MQNILKLPWAKSQNAQNTGGENYLKTTGNHQFFIDVSVQGQAPYHSSVLVVNGFTKSDRKVAIGLRCKWYRVVDDRSYHLQNLQSNTYRLSPHDIGYSIKIEVSSYEEEYSGTASVLYGPIRIDPLVRKNVENMMTTQQEPNFPIHIYFDNDKGLSQQIKGSLWLQKKELQILLQEKPQISSRYRSVSSAHTSYSQNEKEDIILQYTIDTPFTEINQQDANRLALVYSGGEEDFVQVKNFLAKFSTKDALKSPIRLQIETDCRETRDLILIMMKCNAVNEYLANSQVITQALTPTSKKDSDKSEKSASQIDNLLEVEMIKRELYTMISKTTQLGKDKETLQKSVFLLEEELTKTIETYTSLLKNLSTGNNELSVMLAKELNNTQMFIKGEEEQRYKVEIQTLKATVKELRDEKRNLERRLQSRMGENKNTLEERSLNMENHSILHDLKLFDRMEESRMEKSMMMSDDAQEMKRRLKKMEQENERLKKTVESYKNQNELIRDSYDNLRQSFLMEDEPQQQLKGGSEEDYKELQMLNEMLNIEINTYKIQIESLQEELGRAKAQSQSLSRIQEEATRDQSVAEIKKDWERKIFDLEEALNKSQSDCAALSRKNKEMVDYSKEIKKEIDQLRVEKSVIDGTLFQKNKENEAMHIEIQRVRRNCNRVFEENRKLLEERSLVEEKVKSSILNLNKKGEELEEIRKGFAEDMLKLRVENSELKQELQTLIQAFESHKDFNVGLDKMNFGLEEKRKEMEAKERSIRELTDRILAFEQEIPEKQRTIEEFTQVSLRLEQDVENQKKRFGQLTEANLFFEQEIREQERKSQEFTEIGEEIETKKKNRKELAEVNLKLEQEVKEQERKSEQLNREISELHLEIQNKETSLERLSQDIERVEHIERETLERYEQAMSLVHDQEKEIQLLSDKSHQAEEEIEFRKQEEVKLQQRLEIIYTNCQDLVSKVGLAEHENQSLFGERNSVLEQNIKRAEEELSGLQRNLAELNQKIKAESEILEAKREEFETLERTIQEKNNDIEKKLKEKEMMFEKVDNLEREVEKKIRNKIEEKRKEKEQVVNELKEVENVVCDLRQRIENQFQEKEQISKSLRELEMQVNEIKPSLEDKLKEKSELNEPFMKLEAEIKHNRQEFKQSQIVLEKLKFALKEKEQECQNENERLKQVESEFDNISSKRQDFENKLAQCQQDIEEKQRALEDGATKLEHLERKNKDLDQEKVNLQKGLEDKIETESRYRREITDIELLVEELTIKINSVTANKNLLQESYVQEQKSLEALDEQIQNLESEKQDKQRKLEEGKQKVVQLQKELGLVIQDRQDILEDESNSVKKLKDLQNAFESKNHEFETLLQERDVVVQKCEKKIALLLKEKEEEKMVHEQEVSSYQDVVSETRNKLQEKDDLLIELEQVKEALSNQNKIIAQERDQVSDEYAQYRKETMIQIETLKKDCEYLRETITQMELDQTQVISEYDARIGQITQKAEIYVKQIQGSESLLEEKEKFISECEKAIEKLNHDKERILKQYEVERENLKSEKDDLLEEKRSKQTEYEETIQALNQEKNNLVEKYELEIENLRQYNQGKISEQEAIEEYTKAIDILKQEREAVSQKYKESIELSKKEKEEITSKYKKILEEMKEEKKRILTDYDEKLQSLQEEKEEIMDNYQKDIDHIREQSKKKSDSDEKLIGEMRLEVEQTALEKNRLEEEVQRLRAQYETAQQEKDKFLETKERQMELLEKSIEDLTWKQRSDIESLEQEYQEKLQESAQANNECQNMMENLRREKDEFIQKYQDAQKERGEVDKKHQEILMSISKEQETLVSDYQKNIEDLQNQNLEATQHFQEALEEKQEKCVYFQREKEELAENYKKIIESIVKEKESLSEEHLVQIQEMKQEQQKLIVQAQESYAKSFELFKVELEALKTRNSELEEAVLHNAKQTEDSSRVQELEKKVNDLLQDTKNNDLMLQNLKKVNENMMNENANLTIESSNLLDELEYYKSLAQESMNKKELKLEQELDRVKNMLATTQKDRDRLQTEVFKLSKVK